MTGEQQGETFRLLPIMRGKDAGRLVISRLVPDHDFDPPVLVEREQFGPFDNREQARQFMLNRSPS